MKIVFWNVDTQKDFMNKDGKLYIPGAEDIKDNLKTLTNLAFENNIKVVNTADWHTLQDAELSDKPDFKTTFPPHCITGTDGAKFIPETSPKQFKNNCHIVNYYDTKIHLNNLYRSRNIIILKDKFDVFNGNDLTEEIVYRLNPNIIIVYGVATNVCVDLAVKGLVHKVDKIAVVVDAIMELPDTDIDTIYDGWEQNGVKLFTMKDVIECLK